jgi:hypothetical protein
MPILQIESVRRRVKFYLSLVLEPTLKGFTGTHLQFSTQNLQKIPICANFLAF